MVALKILAVGGIAGVLSNITGYVITGLVFHRYQAQTPNTWRSAESWTHYLYSAGVRILRAPLLPFCTTPSASAFPAWLPARFQMGLVLAPFFGLPQRLR